MTPLRPTWCRDAPEGHVHRVLLAEDDAALRDLVTDFLHAERFAVAARADGAAALEEARLWWPCVALVDLTMPGTDGPTFISACRADADLREVPILVATGAAAPSAALAVQGVVPKPFDLGDLLASLVAVIGDATMGDDHPLVGRITSRPPTV